MGFPVYLIRFLLGTMLVPAVAVLAHGAHDGHKQHNKPIKMSDNVATDFSNHPCRRPCRYGEKPRICEYEMHVGWYVTMGRACGACSNKLSDCEKVGCILGSGTQRNIITVNRHLPGPSIEVCLGDQIRVKVINMLQNGETTSVHWHGLHQKKTPFMDGAPSVTQCPIQPGTDFTYDFEADMTGTYFWHSHTGQQRGDGMAGSLIIRDPKDPHKDLYDKDNLDAVIVQDWLPIETASQRFVTNEFGRPLFNAPQLLLNGRSPSHGITEKPGNPTLPAAVPAYVYRLNSKHRYRFRIINNAFLSTPIKFEMTGHHFVVIASDGHSIKPVVTKSLTVMPAERYDVIPFFTGEVVSKNAVYYLTAIWIESTPDKPVQAFAKIIYNDGKNPERSTAWRASGRATNTVLKEVNYFDWEEYGANYNGSEAKKVSQLRSISNHKNNVEGKPDVKLLIEIDLEPVKVPIEDTGMSAAGGHGHGGDQPAETETVVLPRINQITGSMSPVPLLSQWKEVPKDMICNSKHRKCKPDEYCPCIHLQRIPYGALVEMVIVDRGFFLTSHEMEHPMHLHGYHFRVVASDIVKFNLTGKEVLEMDKKGLIKRNLKYAPLKDVVGVPVGGYVIIRFRADNPGFWFFHCHIDFHMEEGMMMVFKVGSKKDMAPIPKSFPKCRSWEPRQHM